MSDRMRPIAFGDLMTWILKEYEQSGSVFGVKKLYRHDGGKLPIFKEKLELPFGPAAGPHTQLSQNIVAAYAAGSRFFELKTVQKLDGEDLPVAKPCITAADECYNCEWSTELYVPQALAEYVRGWFACKLLAKELQLGDPDGFVFNMSVGYDLEGIKTPKIDGYIEGMKNAENTEVWAECKRWTLDHLNLFKHVDAAFVEGISPQISDSITLSTLHGCLPQEIERIAAYLITEKNLNTYVKCNPTLLGYEYARKTLDDLGYDYIVFDDHHFKEDLQFKDAAPMFRRLSALTQERGLEFGVKLTNTFPVDVAAGELPSEEMYMSGRSLFPLTISVAKLLAEEFGGKLRISFSGGADAFNIKALFDAGIWPVTMATTMLKPGGYQRLYQIAKALTGCGSEPFSGVDPAAVNRLVDGMHSAPHYKKPIKPIPPRKLKDKVPLFDCFTAPCRGGCPIEQDIPAYLRLVGDGNYTEALRVVTERNPLPFITGTICSHRCMEKCTRGFYEESVNIRAAKLEAAEKGIDGLMGSLKKAKPQEGKKVAVVGAGPAGLAAAYFLARAGVAVTVFERRESAGGIVRHVIPAFRISEEAIERDVALARAMGAEFKFNTEVKSVEELKSQGFTHVIFANGAWKPGKLGLEYGEAVNVIEFLEAARMGKGMELGENVVIVGGGNTAMDAARAATRLPGVKHVRIVYRRDRRNMPAEEEELCLALEDGVEFCELLAPVGIKNGKLLCKKMELGAPDVSGRRSPVDTGETTEVPADTLISAVGEKVETSLYETSGVAVTDRGLPVTDPKTMETGVSGVYVVGDAQHGATVVVDAIADAMKAAKAIADAVYAAYDNENIHKGGEDSALAKKGTLCADCKSCAESERCLECATICEVCTDVCPNRANVAVAVSGKRMRQIIHMDGMCNECGNCATFCPYNSAPYKDKLTLFWNEADFADSENQGFLLLDAEKELYRVRMDGQVWDEVREKLPSDLGTLLFAMKKTHSYLF